MSEDKKLYLIYAERLSDMPNAKGLFEYEFFFSEMPEVVWGIDWNQPCPSACDIENLRPEPSTYNETKKLYSIIQLKCAQDNSCFSMQDMTDYIIPCVWEDISEYEDYPEPFRLVFKFGEPLESVEDKLAQRHQFFSETKITNEE